MSLLALGAEDHAAQLLDDQLQMFDLLHCEEIVSDAARAAQQPAPSTLHIELIEVGKRADIHGISMP